MYEDNSLELIEYFYELDSDYGGYFDVDNIKCRRGYDRGDEYFTVVIRFLKEYDPNEVLNTISSLINKIRSIGDFDTITENRKSDNYGVIMVGVRSNREDPWLIGKDTDNKYTVYINADDVSFNDIEEFEKRVYRAQYVAKTERWIISIRELNLWFKKI